MFSSTQRSYFTNKPVQLCAGGEAGTDKRERGLGAGAHACQPLRGQGGGRQAQNHPRVSKLS